MVMVENVGEREMCLHLVSNQGTLGVWSECGNDCTTDNCFQKLLLYGFSWDLLDSTILFTYHSFLSVLRLFNAESVSTIPHKQHVKFRSVEHPQIIKF